MVVRSQAMNEESDVRHVVIDQSMFGGARRLGLSIRGGAEHGLGVYVSSVDPGSVAEERGLVPGDLILAVNGISFRKVTNNEAIRVSGLLLQCNAAMLFYTVVYNCSSNPLCV